MSELTHCPFCGSDGVEMESDGHGGWWFFCHKCHTDVHMPYIPKRRREQCVEQWNTRPAEDALKAEVERLKTKAGRAETWIDALSDMLQKIITVTSSENSKKLDPEETVKWINDRARHVIEVMNEVYGCGTDSDVPTNAPDTKIGGGGEKGGESAGTYL